MLTNFIDSVKRKKAEIMLALIVALISLLSFALGYIAKNYQTQQGIQFMQNSDL